MSNKERSLLNPLSDYIEALTDLEKDLAVLEVKNNRSSVRRVKRALLIIDKEHHKALKASVEKIRKEIDNK